MKQESQIVGNTGLFYACYRLSTMGWNVMPTARNARGIEIFANSPEVKPLSKGVAEPDLKINEQPRAIPVCPHCRADLDPAATVCR